MRRELAAAGIHDPALRASYERCRQLNARNGKTYYLATLLLPPDRRPYVHALYGFARYADDLVDLDADLTAPDRVARFRAWSADFLTDLEAGRSADPVGRALLDTVQRWHIPTDYFRDFLESMAMDLTVTEYATYADLERYMWGSAAVIGLQMLPILGRADDSVTPEALEPRAIALGQAFQLTNFIRDVGEDLDRGRIYLPQDTLTEFGVDRELLAQRRITDPIRQALRYESARARRLYQLARPGIELVDPRSQPCLRTAFTLYGAILDEVERQDYDVFGRRAVVSRRRRGTVAARGLISAWGARRSGDRSTPRSPR